MLLRANEAKTISNSYHNKDMDKLIELNLLIREQSAKGKYKVEYEWKEITDAYGTNNLNTHHQRILFELTKMNYTMEFDCVNGIFIIIWG